MVELVPYTTRVYGPVLLQYRGHTKKQFMFYTYIIKMSNDKLYAGSTSDLKRRVREHQNGGNKTTKKYLPVSLIFYEAFYAKNDAIRREAYFKTTKGKTTLRIMLRESLL